MFWERSEMFHYNWSDVRTMAKRGLLFDASFGINDKNRRLHLYVLGPDEFSNDNFPTPSQLENNRNRLGKPPECITFNDRRGKTGGLVSILGPEASNSRQTYNFLLAIAARMLMGSEELSFDDIPRLQGWHNVQSTSVKSRVDLLLRDATSPVVEKTSRGYRFKEDIFVCIHPKGDIDKIIEWFTIHHVDGLCLASSEAMSDNQISFVAQRFYQPRISKETVCSFAQKYWEIGAVSCHGSDVMHGSLVDASLWNSNRYLLRGAKRDANGANNKQYLIREVLRKAVAQSNAMNVKHALLKWLVRDMHFPAVEGLKTRDSNDHFIVPHTDGPSYEIYQYLPGVSAYGGQGEARRQLVRILIALLRAGRVLPPELRKMVGGRFPPDVHQFHGMTVTPDRVRELVKNIAVIGRAGAEKITAVGDQMILCLQERERSLEGSTRSRTEGASSYLTHGDITETNLLYDQSDRNLLLIDWDSVRLTSLPFDLAFALMRVARPDRDAKNLDLGSDQIDDAQRLLDDVCRGLHDEREQLFGSKELLDAFEEVRFEFCLRMVEYFSFISEMSSDYYIDEAYLCRCNPGRVTQLKSEIKIPAAFGTPTKGGK